MNELVRRAEFLVTCLCAEWCGTCREYRTGFDALATKFPEQAFLWVDVEDQAELVDEIDVENFPTLVIQRGSLVLFCGPMLPQLHLLERLIETFQAQSWEESEKYALKNPERAQWQELANIRGRFLA